MNLFVFTTFIYLMHFANYAVVALPTVPVFMLDYEQVMAHVHIDPNPFEKMTTKKFSEIINDSARRSTGVIIFLEKKFSIEDISTKDVTSGTPYKNLHASLKANRETLKYFPSVIDPYKVLLKTFPQTQRNVHHLAQNSKLRLKDNFRYLYILFNDGPKESKADILRRHDTVIKEVMSAARRLKAGPILAYYTGKENPVYVPKVEYVKNLPNAMSRRSGVFLSSPWALLRVFGIFTGTQTRRAVHSETPTVSAERRTTASQKTRWRFTEFELEWVFQFDPDYWRIIDIVMYEGQEEVGRAILNVQVPYNRSYYCPEPIMIINTRDGSVVTFEQILSRTSTTKYSIRDGVSSALLSPKRIEELNEMDYPVANTTLAKTLVGKIRRKRLKSYLSNFNGIQVAPTGSIIFSKYLCFVDQVEPKFELDSTVFNPSVHCTPYFNGVVLSALFVTYLLLSIMSYGVIMMFDCAGNDRFEDPDGKPLVHEQLH